MAEFQSSTHEQSSSLSQADTPIRRVHDYYEFAEVLGSGAFSEVKKATRKEDGLTVAIKCIPRQKLSQHELENLNREISIMRDIRHPHVIRLLDVFDEEFAGIYLVQEYAEGGELFDRITRKTVYNEEEARVVVVLLLATLAHLHGHGVVHRDIKPENILLASRHEDTVVKLADFGFAKYIRDLKGDRRLCGTPDYVAPELLQRQGYGASVDVWSCGVVVYILLGGYPPFYNDNDAVLFKKIVSGDFEFHAPFWDPVSEAGKDLIRQMLTLNPQERPTAAALLQHPWVTGQAKGQCKASGDLTGAVEQLKRWTAKRRLKSVMSSVKAVHRFKHYSGAFGEADSASFLARIERELAEDDEIMRVSEQLLAQTPTLPPPPLDATASDPAAAAAAVIADATPHLQRPPSWASLPKLTMQYHHVVTATKAATAAAPTVTGPSSQLLLPQNKAALAFSNLSKRNSSSSNSSSSNSSSSSSSRSNSSSSNSSSSSSSSSNSSSRSSSSSSVNSTSDSCSNDIGSNSSYSNATANSNSSSSSCADANPSALKRGRSFESSYALGPALGKGSFSVVHRCYAHNRSNRGHGSDTNDGEGSSSLSSSASEPTTCAVKVVARNGLSAANETALRREEHLLRGIDHPNVMKLHEFYESPSHFYMVSELFEGGELFDRICSKTTYGETEARNIARDLMSSVAYLHSLGIVHRNLKPENIMLRSTGSDTDFALLDFSFAKHVEDAARDQNLCGTADYIAPEVFTSRLYSTAVDVWACGVILYILLAGYPPFDDDDDEKLFAKITAGVIEFSDECWSRVSVEARQCIESMLTVDPARRATADQILVHPWFTSGKSCEGGELTAAVVKLKKWRARKRMKGGAKAVLALRAFQSHAQSSATKSFHGTSS